MAQFNEMITMILVYVLPFIVGTLGADIYYDFENANDCSRYYAGPQRLTPDDKVYLTANPRQSNFGGPTECVIKFEATERWNGLRFFTKHFTIYDCGVTLEIYDQNSYMRDPKWILRCESPANQVYVVEGGEMTLRLAKSSSSSFNYRFDTQVTTKDSPRIEYPSEYYRPGTQRATLTEGAIIGISISCVVAGGVLIVIIVLAIRKKRNDRDNQPVDFKDPALQKQQHY